jgi:hypothetical protein
MGGLAGRLEPAPPPAEVAATSKNHNCDEYDQKKCRRVHDVLLWGPLTFADSPRLFVAGRRRSGQARDLPNVPN